MKVWAGRRAEAVGMFPGHMVVEHRGECSRDGLGYSA